MTYSYVQFMADVHRHRAAQDPKRGVPACFVCDRIGRLDLGVRREAADRAICERNSVSTDAHHLVPKQVLKREHPNGVVRTQEGWLSYDPRLALVPPNVPPGNWTKHARPLSDLLMDPRNGIIVRRHHHDLLEARRIVLPRHVWPEDALDFAEELGLSWWVDKIGTARR